jgi:hypothetical protein
MTTVVGKSSSFEKEDEQILKRKYGFTITLVPSSIDFSDAGTGAGGGGGRGHWPPIFCYQLTLFQPRGGGPLLPEPPKFFTFRHHWT